MLVSWAALKRGVATTLRDVILPLSSSQLAMPYLECCIQFCAPLYKKEVELLQRVQQKSDKDSQGTGAPLIGGKAGRAGIVQPEEGEGQGNLINVHEYLKGRRKEDRDSLFSVLSWYWAPLKHKRFLLSVRKHDFTLTEQQDRLPTEAVVSPFLDVFKSHLRAWSCLSREGVPDGLQSSLLALATLRLCTLTRSRLGSPQSAWLVVVFHCLEK